MGLFCASSAYAVLLAVYSVGDAVTVSWRSNYSAAAGPLLVQLVLDAPRVADRRAYAQLNSTDLAEGTPPHAVHVSSAAARLLGATSP